ncbi:hypothetical protein ALC57_11015 [Trachymyrmex cornetzi]|uniref:THAP-type domain-containing protein n=1 Tax=Trachymyrmex cornetzi TaxID=471704 RepID=A0A151J2Y7_9HYME|nr:hypothetical protein ALC57_11015 [Trachymyrmex cornetzi]
MVYAAPFCTNSATKGYIMKIFLRDTKRRALWATNVEKKLDINEKCISLHLSGNNFKIFNLVLFDFNNNMSIYSLNGRYPYRNTKNRLYRFKVDLVKKKAILFKDID